MRAREGSVAAMDRALGGLKAVAKRKCVRCRLEHARRPWSDPPGLCLACDIRGRVGRGETCEAVAARFDLPTFLIRELTGNHPRQGVDTE